jgi:hypothetical protein
MIDPDVKRRAEAIIAALPTSDRYVMLVYLEDLARDAARWDRPGPWGQTMTRFTLWLTRWPRATARRTQLHHAWRFRHWPQRCVLDRRGDRWYRCTRCQALDTLRVTNTNAAYAPPTQGD